MQRLNSSKLIVTLLFLSCLTKPACAVNTNVSTAQALQSALTLAAANGADNTIYLNPGYYSGNFSYNSSGNNTLTIQGAPGTTNTQIAIDGTGIGSGISISSSGSGNITVAGITFLRNCGSANTGALSVAGGGGATILVSGCQFLSPTNTIGTGLALVSGLNATVTNCIVTGTPIGGVGVGLSSSSLPGNITVANCTVNSNLGGGISISGANVITISASTFTANTSFNNYIGGASCSGATVVITGSTFNNNYVAANCSGTTVTFLGNNFIGNANPSSISAITIAAFNNTFTANTGALTCGGGFATITGNTFKNNTSGALTCSGIDAIVCGNSFIGNSAPIGNGGGLFMKGNLYPYSSSYNVINTFTVSNNTFVGNSGRSGAGAFFIGGRALVLSANIFNQNSASENGGGFFAECSTINISDNLVVQNTASGGGGAFFGDDNSSITFSNVNLVNNTITSNNVTGNGGGAYFQVSGIAELLNVYNNIIWGNTAAVQGGQDVYLSATGQTNSFLYNDVNDMRGAFWNIIGNNLNVAPNFFNQNGDYHVKPPSLCLNAGTNGAPFQPLTDLEGNSRTNSAGFVDMGCYQFNTNAYHPADTDSNFVITASEYSTYAAAWKTGQGWSNGPSPISADYVTRAGYILTNGGHYYNDGSARPVNWKTNSVTIPPI